MKNLLISILTTFVMLSGSLARADIRFIPNASSSESDPKQSLVDSMKSNVSARLGNDRDAVLRGKIDEYGDLKVQVYSCPTIKTCTSRGCTAEVSQPQNWQCTLQFEGNREALCERDRGSAAVAKVTSFLASQILGGLIVHFSPYGAGVAGDTVIAGRTTLQAHSDIKQFNENNCPGVSEIVNAPALMDSSTLRLVREESVGDVKTLLSSLSSSHDEGDQQKASVTEFDFAKPGIAPLQSKLIENHLTNDQCSYFDNMNGTNHLDRLALNLGYTDLAAMIAAVKADCGLDGDPKKLPNKRELWHIEGNDDFVLYTDGQKVSFGKQALADAASEGTDTERTLSLTELNSGKTMPGYDANILSRAMNRLKFILDNGELVFVLPMYTDHDRTLYTPEMRSRLNAHPYGFGIGKELTDDDGNTQRLTASCFQDSNKDIECSLSYDYLEKIAQLGGFTLSAGLSSGITKRQDLGRYPIPFVLPTATLQVKKVKFNLIFIPRFRAKNGGAYGGVTFLYATIPLNLNKAP